MYQAESNGVPVTDEDDPLPLKKPANMLRLQKHISGLHENLVKLTQGTWTIVHHIGDSVQACSQINCHVTLSLY